MPSSCRVATDEATATLSAQRIVHADGSRLLAIRYEVVEGPAKGATGELAHGRGFVGRSPGADVTIDDPAVSLFHVEVWGTEGGVTVRDLASRNGTWIGDIAIERGVAPSGASLTIGGSRVVLECRGPAIVERSKASGFGALVGASMRMREIYALLEKLASTSITVLLEGATGTGKELAARALHERGPRAGGPFVAVSCAALPPALVEATLFGYEATASGDDAQPGLFERASGGTLLFDEIAELPLDVQAKLVRVVEEQEVIRVGGAEARRVDTRVIATTRQDLRHRMNRGEFREDLYFRIAQARVHMPALDERPEDTKPLAQHFLSALPWESTGARAFSKEALDALASRRFPGNVRELKSSVERAALVSAGPTISVEDLAFERTLAGDAAGTDTAGTDAGSSGAGSSDDKGATGEIPPFKDAKQSVVDEFERAYVKRLLERSGDNVSRAAALAGIERQSFRALLRRHGVRGE